MIGAGIRGGLPLAGALALAAVDPDRGRPRRPAGDALDLALAALVVAELEARGRVVLAPGGSDLAVLDPTPTGDALLDDALRAVDRRRTVVRVVGRLNHDLPGTWRRVAGRLTDAGLLQPERCRRAGILPATRWVVQDPAARGAVIAWLTRAAATTEPLEPQAALLLDMALLAGLLRVLLPARRDRDRAGRHRLQDAIDASPVPPAARAAAGAAHRLCRSREAAGATAATG